MRQRACQARSTTSNYLAPVVAGSHAHQKPWRFSYAYRSGKEHEWERSHETATTEKGESAQLLIGTERSNLHI